MLRGQTMFTNNNKKKPLRFAKENNEARPTGKKTIVQKEPSKIDVRRKIAKFMVVCMNVPLLNVSAPRHYLYSIIQKR